MSDEGVEPLGVDEDLVVGKVFALVWPSDRWDWIGTSHAFDSVDDAD